MEQFVQSIVGGGVVLLCGLWIGAFSAAYSGVWLLGAVLVLFGLGGLTYGIGREIEL
ncbi:hypothetical protein HAPAU_26980 [Halalkalicoccus paucihalophilus]|uniref:Uncharacterized protein n=1 Tax=Halalkalicoccus paucihalophilus TaxID=1008153 RepID=A0A151ABV1_9EURY|nr:hypothetical protein [Halalkalicoccus paucihalophilus]KYH25115.1 hypothetical protein HAPAU_26980 [Halalkalicoccus paucihalophilus]